MQVNPLEVQLDGPAEKIDPTTKLQWVHILTPGVIECSDGRAFVLKDADEVIANTLDVYGTTDLVVDYEHDSSSSVKPKAGPVPAAGWVKKLENRQGNVWALVQWTDLAAKMISERQYRYISPEFRSLKGTGIIKMIDAIALVNRPAMTLTSIASNQGMGDDNMANDDADFLKMAAQLLGIEGQYTPAQILTKLQKLVQDNPVIEEEEVSAIASLMRDLNTERYQTQTARQEAKVTAAITSGHMPPHMRGWMTRLCKQDEEAFDELLGNTKPIVNIVPEEFWDRKNLASSGHSINGGMAADQVAAQLGIDANKIR